MLLPARKTKLPQLKINQRRVQPRKEVKNPSNNKNNNPKLLLINNNSPRNNKRRRKKRKNPPNKNQPRNKVVTRRVAKVENDELFFPSNDFR